MNRTAVRLLFATIVLLLAGCDIYITNVFDRDSGDPVADVPRGRIAWFPFDGSVDNVLSENGYATSSGASFVADLSGRQSAAIHFDGVDDYVDVYDAELRTGLPVTYSARVRLDELKGASVFADDYARNLNFGVWMSFASDGRIAMNVGDGTQLGFRSRRTRRSDARLEPGRWYHIAGTAETDRSGRIVFRLYIDGMESNGYYDGEATTIAYGHGHPTFGRRDRSHEEPSDESFFHGALDDFMIFNRVLAEEEIRRLSAR